MESMTSSTPPYMSGSTSLAFADSNAALAQLGRYTADLKRLVREREQVLRQIEQAHRNSLTLLSRAAEKYSPQGGRSCWKRCSRSRARNAASACG